MDKKSIIIVVTLGLLVIFWVPIMTQLGIIKPSQRMPDSIQTHPSDSTLVTDSRPTIPAESKAVSIDTVSTIFTADTSQNIAEDSIVIETSLQKIILSNYGGAPVSILLKKYNYDDGSPVQLLPDCRQATPEIIFNGGRINTNDFVYIAASSQKMYNLGSGTAEIIYTYFHPAGGKITKRYRFYPDEYRFDLILEVTDLANMGLDRQYTLEWNNKLSPTELTIQEDYQSMWAMAMMGDIRVKFDDYNNDMFSETQDGQTDWIATRSKYFASIMIPHSRPAIGAKAAGVKAAANILGQNIETRELRTGLVMEIAPGESMIDSFEVYVGPLDYDILSTYQNNVVDLLDIGTTPLVGWIIKIFAVPILWLLPKMYSALPNYGIVIILFSILVKLITYPLTRKSIKSMAAMKDLQPKMNELKGKHKNNPQALNREMMKLYKEQGVNPLSGCLVFLPQMPLFFALFSVFRSTILLRQAPFIFWWDDLSRGALSLTDPYMILVVLMVGLMFIQQKTTMTDPKNKIFIYLFPLMLGFFFYKASAGLVLYWTMFSLLSFLEQVIFQKTKKQSGSEIVKA